jgi:hypothetical protein
LLRYPLLNQEILHQIKSYLSQDIKIKDLRGFLDGQEND